MPPASSTGNLTGVLTFCLLPIIGLPVAALLLRGMIWLGEHTPLIDGDEGCEPW